jgi:flagellar protein FlaI
MPPILGSLRPVPAPKPIPQPSASTAQFETRPCFASSWVESKDAIESEVVARYAVSGVDVTISCPESSSCGLYTIDPPEYKLTPLQLQALAGAISEVTRAAPSDLEVSSLSTVRPYIKARAKDFIFSQLARRSREETAGMILDREADHLSELLCKYTAGYGVLETLLEDRLIQDIYVDAPSSQTPVHVVLRSDAGPRVRQKCRTNILVGRRDILGFVSRIKLETGLPFSEAHPVLEADIKRLGARVTLVGPPVSEKGVSVAIRKHSADLWTIPRLIANGSLSPLLASFLWACVVGRRTVLIAGSRGAGKTTLLGAVMLEFPLSQRIILIEDTPELSIPRMQELGFDVQTLRFSGASEEGVASAQETLRVSLRMGESAIVIGEVRGAEAKVLYESMRAGSAGSSVLGTIHGNSAKGVLDRAVEDLGVSERAFSSTDIVVVIGLVRSPDGSRFSRRVVEVAEVRERGQNVELVSLFTMEPGCTCAKPTSDFSPECRTISGIGCALDIAPATVMDIVRARAHADQLVSESDGVWEGDEARVQSNEVLTRCLFGKDGPEAGLRDWRDWLDARTSK